MSKDLPDETPELAAAVPARLLEGLRAYAIEHRPVGGFLTAVLSNDMHRAVALADIESIREIRGIMLYVVNALPCDCWGNEAKVAAWLSEKGPTP